MSITSIFAAIDPEDDETVAMIKELLETRIRYLLQLTASQRRDMTQLKFQWPAIFPVLVGSFSSLGCLDAPAVLGITMGASRNPRLETERTFLAA